MHRSNRGQKIFEYLGGKVDQTNGVHEWNLDSERTLSQGAIKRNTRKGGTFTLTIEQISLALLNAGRVSI